MFNMENKSKGIAWVGDIYQKFEAMCMEVDDMVCQVFINIHPFSLNLENQRFCGITFMIEQDIFFLVFS